VFYAVEIRSVETCGSSIIIYQLTVHWLVIVQNKNCILYYIILYYIILYYIILYYIILYYIILYYTCIRLRSDLTNIIKIYTTKPINLQLYPG